MKKILLLSIAMFAGTTAIFAGCGSSSTPEKTELVTTSETTTVLTGVEAVIDQFLKEDVAYVFDKLSSDGFVTSYESFF